VPSLTQEELALLEPTAENAQTYLPPTFIGPTWQKDNTGKWLLPERTLGWEVLGWVATWLTFSDGRPFMCTPEQARFVLWFYAIDHRGKFSYRKAVLQRMKGWGKDPLAAVLSIVELIGPSQFSHWDDNGQPVGKPHPDAYVQVTAVSEQQTENTRDLFPGMIPQATRAAFNMEVQKEVIYANGGKQKLRTMSANFRSAEGGRVTFCIANETHHWTPGQRGPDFMRVISDNLTKVQGRLLCITNAYEPGEESVAQAIREEQEKVWAGLSKPSGWLYDSLEANASAPLTEDWAPHVISTIRGDATWLNIEDIVSELQDGSKTVASKRRMWYNQIVSTGDSLITPADWDGILMPGCYGDKRDLKPGDSIVMGFDGSKTDDATALVAIRISDNLIVPLGIWQNPDPAQEWHVNEAEVDSEVHLAFQMYKVQAFYADVSYWESYVDTWSDLYREKLLIKASARSTVGFDMRGNKARISQTTEAFVGSIQDGRLKQNGHRLMRVHVLNVKRRTNSYGLYFGKETAFSTRKIDGFAAAFLAYMALVALAESGKKPPKEYTRKLYSF
jgi:phage terminase large subunit-like protein